jgi:hypothetical protein
VARAGQKTVRFTQVVQQSGQPQVHTLWLPPDQDPELQRAEKAHRVMTIEHGATGTKADVGTVGFERSAAKHAQFLIFPKSLKRFDGARVIGIKFDLVAQPKLASADSLQHALTNQSGRGAHKVSTAAKPASIPAAFRTDPNKNSEAEGPKVNASQVVPFEPLPHRETKSRTQASRVSAPTPKRSRDTDGSNERGKNNVSDGSTSASVLRREIRAAMKDLERGKSVAAYQRLQRAISK